VSELGVGIEVENDIQIDCKRLLNNLIRGLNLHTRIPRPFFGLAFAEILTF